MNNLDNLALNLPFNSTSFGNIGFSIAREFYSRGANPNIFPIGGLDFSTQTPDEKFFQWIQLNAQKAIKSHNRKHPCIKLWHTNMDSLPSLSSDSEIFITFIETDAITEYEKNILSQKKTVFVTSNYTKRVMDDYGLNNVKYIQLGFDSHNFKKIDKKYWDDDRVVFSLLGKFENRKHHKKVIQAWLKKFGVPRVGVKTKYRLHCAIYNPFLVQNVNGQQVDHNPRVFQDAMSGKEWGNIEFCTWFPNNQNYNDYLQSNHIVIGMGGGENFGAGEFHSVGLGKHAVILNANGFKDWANAENSSLVSPSGKIDSHDGVFFHKGNVFQQGSFFCYDDDEFISRCEDTIKKVESNPTNIKGLELQNRTYKETVDQILKEI